MEDEQYLQALLEVLREEDGTLLRSLLKSLGKNKDPSAKRLTEVLIQHPAPHPRKLIATRLEGLGQLQPQQYVELEPEPERGVGLEPGSERDVEFRKLPEAQHNVDRYDL